MKPFFQRLMLMLLAGPLCCAMGCFGVTQNPSYFPRLWPTGDIIQTHAKPGLGFYSNFDPHAVKLEIRPIYDRTSPVRSQHVIIATVYDEKDTPRRNRRVEWLIEGVGHIIEVDESGFFPGRGYKTTDKYAVSYTSLKEVRVNRGNGNKGDDFMIRPGQTWCIVSSPIEGDTHVTAYAPAIYDWQKQQVHTTVRWVDATWEFPQPARARAGTQHIFTTKIFRHTDKRPLEGYKVRYKILDGPPAIFENGRTEYEATSDLSGNATALIRQPQANIGINKIAVEIVRPPDGFAGVGVTLGAAETTIEWLSPQISLVHTGPASATLGQDVVYETIVSNNGPVESQAMTIVSLIPEALQYLPNNPRAVGDPATDGRSLSWALGPLAPGGQHRVAVVYKAIKEGTVTHCASVTTVENQRDEKCVSTTIGTAQLKVAITGPQAVAVNGQANFQITVSNPGNTPLNNVLLLASLTDGLTHASGAANLTLGPESLAGGASKDISLPLTARKPGNQTVTVQASSDNLTDQAQATVLVTQPQVSLSLDGPKTKYIGKQADWKLSVANTSNVPLSGVTVRDKLPTELVFFGADEGGRFENNEVVWTVPMLQPGERRELRFTTTCQTPTKAATQFASVTADGVSAQAQATLEIYPTPAALKLEMIDQGDPVQVGKTVLYQVKITNTGLLPANRVAVVAKVPPQLRAISAKGPNQEGRIQQGIVEFAPIDGVAKDQVLQFTIECQALQAGDVRFRIQVAADSLDPLQPPLFEEESTRIFENGGGTGAAIPPPP